MTLLRISQIKRDGGTQPRAHLNPQTVAEYAAAMADEDCTFPPVTVFYDGADYWLADGFHRVAASIEAGFVDIEADIRQGTRRDAVLFSVGANAKHGLPRTAEDKRRAVQTLLGDEEWSQQPLRWIARQAEVSEGLVRKMVGEASAHGTQIATRPEVREVTRGGVTYQQNTANIGRTREPREEPPPPPRPVPRSQIATTVTQDTPEERRIGRHAGFVLEASDRLLAAVECWPDPAAAAPHLEGYAVFLEQLPIVASWLGRLDELLKAASTPEHLATE